jgi:ubiquinone biosynthesis monooxygenase Coq7
MHQTVRQLSPLDHLLDNLESALGAIVGTPTAARPSPAEPLEPVELNARESRQAAGLMRVDHTGEVCAQALYKGQALLARDEATREHLEQAASEETDHLAWCAARLTELDARESVFNPLWYVGSHAMGALAAATSDRVSLGFVVETERQVEAHLTDHLARLPRKDLRSRAILAQMQADEVRHADNALKRGGVPLPAPAPTLMRMASKVMKMVAYRM